VSGSAATNRLAIFDCDGTLVDSGQTIYVALERALTAHGLVVPSPAQCRRVIGLSLVEAIAQLLPDQAQPLHLGVAETYKKSFHGMRAAGDVCEPLFDGIADLLHELEREGWLLAVATGKSDRGLRLCLESHGIHARFVSLQTADRHPSKPHPSMVLTAMAEAGAEPGTTIVIGDTSFDMGMAVAAGAHAIGAAWGYHDAKELLDAGARAVAGSPADVLAIASRLVEAEHAG
jgi:phosphoglycolate phosphatase